MFSQEENASLEMRVGGDKGQVGGGFAAWRSHARGEQENTIRELQFVIFRG